MEIIEVVAMAKVVISSLVVVSSIIISSLVVVSFIIPIIQYWILNSFHRTSLLFLKDRRLLVKFVTRMAILLWTVITE